MTWKVSHFIAASETWIILTHKIQIAFAQNAL